MTETTAVAKQPDSQRNETPFVPPVDVVEDATGITLYADLPGVPKDQLSLQIDAGTLTIEGAISLGTPDDIAVTHAEVSLPRYRRVFTLSNELNTEDVSAQFDAGVLRLRIPKTERAQPRKIEIKAG